MKFDFIEVEFWMEEFYFFSFDINLMNLLLIFMFIFYIYIKWIISIYKMGNCLKKVLNLFRNFSAVHYISGKKLRDVKPIA
jgi:hypothetical protein